MAEIRVLQTEISRTKKKVQIRKKKNSDFDRILKHERLKKIFFVLLPLA